MAFAKVGLQREGLVRVPFDLRLAFIGRIEPMINAGERGGEPRVSEREGRIVLDRFGVEPFRELEILEQAIRIRFVTARFQVKHVSVGILRRFGYDPVFLFRAQGRPQLGGNL